MHKSLVFILYIVTSTLNLTYAGGKLTNDELEALTTKYSIIELQTLMSQNKLSSEQLVTFYLNKIEKKDKHYNSIITINPEALAIAAKRDQQRQQGNVLGLLHGIPVVVKDNIETKSMPTTAGSLALKNNFTNRDAPLIQNLKKQGAIILAKTNLSEWANFRSERSSSGWSAIGGQTKNPHNTSRSTCGSSSGSGAAIAANLAVAAVGTETDGSIVCPASATGITGIKPQLGLVSQQGIVPIAHTQDTAGPMAKSITDAAILLNAMSVNPISDELLLHTLNQTNSLSKLKLGALDSPALKHEKVNHLFQQFLVTLRQNKVKLTQPLSFSPYSSLYGDEYSVLLYEFKNDLNAYLAQLPNQFNKLTLAKLIEFNNQNHKQAMPFFQQEIFELANNKGDLNESEYKEQLAKIKQATRQDGIDKLFADHNLDAIISITLGPSWKIDKVNGDHYPGGVSSYSAISGYPHITIPLGKVHELPIGLSIIGNKDSDFAMIKIAKELEQLIQQK